MMEMANMLPPLLEAVAKTRKVVIVEVATFTTLGLIDKPRLRTRKTDLQESVNPVYKRSECLPVHA